MGNCCLNLKCTGKIVLDGCDHDAILTMQNISPEMYGSIVVTFFFSIYWLPKCKILLEVGAKIPL